MPDVTLTPAQERALSWLRQVSTADRKAILARGFRPKTLDALVQAGLAKVEDVTHDQPLSMYRAVW